MKIIEKGESDYTSFCYVLIRQTNTMNYWSTNSPLGGIPMIKNATSHRASSYDVTGGNKDYWQLDPGKTATIMDEKGTGCIKHIWMTIWCEDPMYLRKLVLEMYWDNEENPSVRVPLGDFFGVGHGLSKRFSSLPLTAVNDDTVGIRKGRYCPAFNSYFPMPFGDGAKIKIVNDSDNRIERLFFMIDYDLTDEAIPADVGRFHAQFRNEYPCKKIEYPMPADRPMPGDLPGVNLDGKENYVILDAEGEGQYVGCILSIDNFNAPNQMYTWPGEGDDMIFIDGEVWPPSLHGTGTEDYFCAAWGYPGGEYSAPYHGVTLGSDTQEYFGKWSMYRFHIEDPVRFKKSIKVTIEHGHANDQGNDYSSVAYWYQIGPHKPHGELPKDRSNVRGITHGLWERRF